jgi:hypothetical protein
MTGEYDQTVNLDSRALASVLVQQGHDAIMDCDTHRVAAMVCEATQDMSPEQLRRLIHQMAWLGGLLAARLPDNQRLATLAGFVTTNGD